jgi:uncharacterized protein (DUF2252 family)
MIRPTGLDRNDEGRTVADRLNGEDAGRDPRRLALKYSSMRDDVWAFLRATPRLFHERMAELDFLPAAPAAWCCGDLHLENFGTYRGDNGLVYFDINDFDGALLAPATLDVLRLVTSLLVAAPGLQIARAAAAAMARHALEAYRSALGDGKSRWVERRTAEGLIAELMRGLRRRDNEAFLASRTQRRKGALRLETGDEHLWALAARDRAQLARWLKHDVAADPPLLLIDAAGRVAGLSSLGITRYALLVAPRRDDGKPQLLDMKAAQASPAAAALGLSQPPWPSEADRVVGVQARCQAIAPRGLRATHYAGAPFVLHPLQPVQDRLQLRHAARSPAEFEFCVQTMAELSAWSQLRSSGRDGSATADALIAFASEKSAVTTVLPAARQLAESVVADWQEFCADYDAGRLATGCDAARRQGEK